MLNPEESLYKFDDNFIDDDDLLLVQDTKNEAKLFYLPDDEDNEIIPQANQEPLSAAMSSIQGAGYPGLQQNQVNLMEKSVLSIGMQQKQQQQLSPAQKGQQMEKKIHQLLEESSAANAKDDLVDALVKAKAAAQQCQVLIKHYENHNELRDNIKLHHNKKIKSINLTVPVWLNLAYQFECIKMWKDAFDAYNLVSQIKGCEVYSVNMGNILFTQKNYLKAIKYYRIAMDSISFISKSMRYRIQRNIGISYLKLGQYPEAIKAFEMVMTSEHGADPQTAFNLLVCYYAHQDRERMKKAFIDLIRLPVMVQNNLLEGEEEKKEDDELSKELSKYHKRVERYVRIAANLIAPVIIENDFAGSFAWVIERLKNPGMHNLMGSFGDMMMGPLNNQIYYQLAMEMEIAKGIAYLKNQQFTQAIETFTTIEMKQETLKDQAANNLSFIYFQLGDYKNSEKFADIAIKANSVNAQAFVNRGNCYFVKQEYEKAEECYWTARGMDSDCVEARYNHGLLFEYLYKYKESLEIFLHLQRQIPNDSCILYHIAKCYYCIAQQSLQNNEMEMYEEYEEKANKWFQIINMDICPSDPQILALLGSLAANQEDNDNMAVPYYSESYRYYPVNPKVAGWLGAYNFKAGFYEKAIEYFTRASELEPTLLIWKMNIANCYLCDNNQSKALELCNDIYRQNPTNPEEIKLLIQIAKRLKNSKLVEEYTRTLNTLQNKQEKEGPSPRHSPLQSPNTSRPPSTQNLQMSQPNSPPIISTSSETEKVKESIKTSEESHLDSSISLSEPQNKISVTPSSRNKPITVRNKSKEKKDLDDDLDFFLPGLDN